MDAVKIWRGLTIIMKNEEGRNTVKSSLQSGGTTAISCVIGCALLGPVGILVGATLGSVGTYLVMKDSFKSIYEVAMEDMNAREREELIRIVNEVLVDRFKKNPVMFLTKIASTSAICISEKHIANVLKYIIRAYIDHKSQSSCNNSEMRLK